MTGRLLKPEEAAKRLGGVPVAPLVRAARDHGLLVMVGRSKRIAENDLPELVRLCRCPPAAPTSPSDAARGESPSGSSATAARSSSGLEQAIGELLNSGSRNTSRRSTRPEGGNPVVPLRPTR